MKRFTEALKWRDPWFRELSADAKLVFFYFIDNCDGAGVWEPDPPMVNFCLKRDVDWDEVWKEFGDRVVKLSSGKLWMRKFIEFQYGVLTETCPPHRTVIALVRKHGLTLEDGVVTLGQPLAYPKLRVKHTPSYPIGRAQEKEKEKEAEQDQITDKETEKPTKTENQLRAEKLFRRRASTPWDASCLKAWDRSRRAVETTHEEDWQLLEWFYALPPEGTYRRHDLPTLLNNWSAEIDRARAFKAKGVNGANRHQLPEATAEDHAKGFYHGLDDEPAPARPAYAHAP
jgi:hypothetical protein